MALGAPAGDGQLAEPRPRGAPWRGLEGHRDVLGLFGGDALHLFDYETRVVHLGGGGVKSDHRYITMLKTLECNKSISLSATANITFFNKNFNSALQSGYFPGCYHIFYLKRERGGLQQDILEGDGNGATGTDAKRALGFGGEAQPLQGEDVVAPDSRGQAELASRYPQLMRFKTNFNADL